MHYAQYTMLAFGGLIIATGLVQWWRSRRPKVPTAGCGAFCRVSLVSGTELCRTCWASWDYGDRAPCGYRPGMGVAGEFKVREGGAIVGPRVSDPADATCATSLPVSYAAIVSKGGKGGRTDK